ncbi:mitochondria-eating protein isoform X3 [Octopus bimaculoides]|nr:mitochondria-eating protein isoform X3 [Octopus bimaculoides]
MAEDRLQRLCRIAPFSRLQIKLVDWLEEFNINSCDQNVMRCCDILELNALIQQELFKLLNQSAAEGGLYGGAAAIKTKFLPWLSHDLISGNRMLLPSFGMQLKDYQLTYQNKEDELRTIQAENAASQDKAKLVVPQASLSAVQELQQDQVVQRFKEMYYTDRMDAMNILKLYCDDQIKLEKIIFTVFQKACSAGRFSLHQYKAKLRDFFDGKYDSPQSKEQLIQEFIFRLAGPYDLGAIVTDVIEDVDSSLNYLLPTGCSISVIQSFIREACKLGWNMACLVIPIDIDLGIETVFDPVKYRRSVNSDYRSRIISHYIWPCLFLGSSLASNRKVIYQGEAETRSTVDQKIIMADPQLTQEMKKHRLSIVI